MKSDHIYHLLAKYFSNEANQEEKASVESWIAESDENRRVFNLLKEVWGKKVEVHQFDDINLEEVLIDTHRKLNSSSDAKSSLGLFRGKLFKYAAAAVFALIVAVSGIIVTQFSEVDSKLVYQSQVGETLDVTLPDRSTITLAPTSKLEVDRDYNAEYREVYLNGEAVFEVYPNKSKPFLVYAQNSVTKVLGTKFDVEAYPENDNVSVYVEEGKVSVNKKGSDNSEVTLSQGDYVRFGEQMTVLEFKRGVDIEAFLQWREGKIRLDNEKLTEGVKKLMRWYPVRFEFEDDQLGQLQLTADFSSEQPLEEVLDAIALATDVEYKRDGNRVIFY